MLMSKNFFDLKGVIPLNPPYLAAVVETMSWMDFDVRIAMKCHYSASSVWYRPIRFYLSTMSRYVFLIAALYANSLVVNFY